MEKTALERAAGAIVLSNVSPNISAAIVEWDQSQRRLRLRYLVDAIPTDDDQIDLELSMAELIAEFPDVLQAETFLSVGRLDTGYAGSAVYVRPSSRSGAGAKPGDAA